jgi:hypothetical protein
MENILDPGNVVPRYSQKPLTDSKIYLIQPETINGSCFLDPTRTNIEVPKGSKNQLVFPVSVGPSQVSGFSQNHQRLMDLARIISGSWIQPESSAAHGFSQNHQRLMDSARIISAHGSSQNHQWFTDEARIIRGSRMKPESSVVHGFSQNRQ